MRIGLTYDLRDEYLSRGYDEDQVAEFDSAETIRAIEDTLAGLGHHPVLVGHIQNLTERLARGERWDLVFNIAEGVRGAGREAQVPALLDAYDIPYTFSDPLTLALALHKGFAKHIVRDHLIPTADFAVVDSVGDVEQIRLPFPLFAKPVAEGSSKGITRASRADNPAELAAVCRLLIEKYRQPVLVEEFLPGREFTVGIIGSSPVGVMEIHLVDDAEPGAYSRSNKQRYMNCVSYSLVEDRMREETIDVAVRAWTALGCRDAGRVDLRCDANGSVNFLEVNPLAGLHPVDSDLVILSRLHRVEYRDLIGRIVASACERTKVDRPHAARA